MLSVLPGHVASFTRRQTFECDRELVPTVTASWTLRAAVMNRSTDMQTATPSTGQSKNVVVVGTQWGDEGKGKIVDWLTDHAQGVVRFQGGHNAGHTLVIAGGKKPRSA